MTTFLGVRSYDFVDKETGKQVQGATWWFSESGQSHAFGMIPFKVSMSNETMAEFLPKIGYQLSDLDLYAGEQCELTFGRNNRLENIKFLGK